MKFQTCNINFFERINTNQMPTKMPKFSQQTQNTNSQPIFTSSATHNHNQKQLPSPNKAKYITHSFIAKQIHTHIQTYHN